MTPASRAALALLGCVAAPLAAFTAEPPAGKRVFDRWCAECHAAGPGHPGTQSLQVKYRGSPPAALEQREDLTADVTRFYVRNGAGLMPFFRKTEIGDAELGALAEYLARRAPENR